ncbi:MAG: 16S rRNA (uracil(1498)-N(3))-methyltransferase [Candidatus Kerfeldbacteria bacterium]|nr:16S rRNA (uracil(1498)-N(3))-methyltransferase [Candidatus Kerfeldbacteria bacterium]
MLHRFYQPQLTPHDDQLTLTDPAVIKQVIHVLRLTVGETFVVFTPQTEYTVTIDQATDDALQLRITKTEPASRPALRPLVLYQALLKKDNFELILQKCTELGVQEFVPLITERTIVREISGHKRERYEKILTEATEQCGGTVTPTLEKPMMLAELMSALPTLRGTALVAYEAENQHPLGQVIDGAVEPIRLIIGPEGGFAPAEITQLVQAGAKPVHLGSRILRAETAAIAAVSRILL